MTLNRLDRAARLGNTELMAKLRIGADPPSRTAISNSEIEAVMQRIADRIKNEMRHDLEHYAEIGGDWKFVLCKIADEEPTRAAANARAKAVAEQHKHHLSFLRKCLTVAEKLAELLAANAVAQADAYNSVYLYEPDRSIDNLNWLSKRRGAPSGTTNADHSDKARGPLNPSVSSDTTTFVPASKIKIICGDALTELAKMPNESATGSLTSVPYHGLRHYVDDPRQIGLEPTIKEWLDNLVAVYHELLRVLKPGALAFIVIGDRYASAGRKTPDLNPLVSPRPRPAKNPDDLASKNLLMLPFRLASALQNDGWVLREIMIWDKGHAGTTSFAADRPDIVHEYVLMLCKSTNGENDYNKTFRLPLTIAHHRDRLAAGRRRWRKAADKNITSVLHIPAERKIKWSAPMPVGVARPLCQIMQQPNAHIIDPFGGSGTTAIAAIGLGMDVTLIELNPEFCKRTKARITKATAPRQLHKPFIAGAITLHHGDGLDGLRRMDSGTVELMIADPPYGTTKLDWDVPLVWELWVPEIWRVLREDGVLIVHSKQPFTNDVMNAFRRQFVDDLHWINPHPANFHQSGRRPLSHVENISIFCRTTKYTYNPQTRPRENAPAISVKRRIPSLSSRQKISHTGAKRQSLIHPRDLLDFGFDERDITPAGVKTPTKKPVALLMYLIETFSNPADMVVDFCSGYASTALAAALTGRKYVGIEQDESRFLLGCDRVAPLVQMDRAAAD